MLAPPTVILETTSRSTDDEFPIPDLPKSIPGAPIEEHTIPGLPTDHQSLIPGWKIRSPTAYAASINPSLPTQLPTIPYPLCNGTSVRRLQHEGTSTNVLPSAAAPEATSLLMTTTSQLKSLGMTGDNSKTVYGELTSMTLVGPHLNMASRTFMSSRPAITRSEPASLPDPSEGLHSAHVQLLTASVQISTLGITDESASNIEQVALSGLNPSPTSPELPGSTATINAGPL